jgi:biotin carboxyl carrier protein
MKKLRVTVAGKTYDVTVEVLSDDDAQRSRPMEAHPKSEVAPATPLSAAAPIPSAAPVSTRSAAGAGAVTSPMAGTVKSVLVKVGDTVAEGQQVVTLDAMKMEVPIAAPIGGTVVEVQANEGQSVQEGQVLLVLG